MECELCGREVGKRFSVKIEVSTMEVCGGCVRYGEKITAPKAFIRGPSGQSPIRKTSSTPIKDFMGPDLFDDFPNIIRVTRERKGMTQEQLGKLINERESVINRMESGKMRPDEKLIRKLESTLHVKITGKVEGEKVSAQRPDKRELTLGDVVKIKRK